jgi:RNA polymerase sigma-70 factor, ECF subfamily
MNAMDDKTVIEKCLAGETEYFSFLVRQYQKEAIGHAAAILGNPDDALDAVQDSFIDAFRALKTFDSSRRFYTWFYTILRNRCFKFVRSRKIQAKTERNELKILAEPSDNSSKAATELVEKALLELSMQEREILTLKHLDGLSYETITQKLEIPIGTVMSRLYHARLKFREKVTRIQAKDNCRENNNG